MHQLHGAALSSSASRTSVRELVTDSSTEFHQSLAADGDFFTAIWFCEENKYKICNLERQLHPSGRAPLEGVRSLSH